jgi:hypothetical protein
MAWVPRGVDPATRDVLTEGVPDYLRPALLEFLKKRLATYSSMSGSWFFVRDNFMRYDLEARLTPSYTSQTIGDTWPGFVARLPGEELLDLADWIIHGNNASVSKELEDILEAAGSVWTVGRRSGNRGLERRVDKSVQAAAEFAIESGIAGRILGEAWSAAYGRGPDPEEAYEKAIKAVEEVTASIVSPKNTSSTLGTTLRDMRAQQSWSLDLPGRSADVINGMIEALWTGQESRHGGNGYRRPTQSEAETAVTLAVAIFQLFESGSVQRR